MRLGFVGLGKLGLPVAEVLATAHEVYGYDIAPRSSSTVTIVSSYADLLARDLDAIFVCVQTPHLPAYEGITPMPSTLADFDYTYLSAAVADLVYHSTAPSLPPLIIVSTVLPGTCREVVEPLLGPTPYVYSPLFAAMGTVTEDLLDPEFTLAGFRDLSLLPLIRSVWAPINTAPILATSVESAELAKVTYNCWISMKVVLSNAIGELARKVYADADEVETVLKHATKRIVSSAYMSHGMSDGGPCHPRDAIAMSWLADQVNLSADPFSFVTHAREAQTRHLAATIIRESAATSLPVFIVGRSYKENTSLETGSASLLLAHYLESARILPGWIDANCGYPAPDPLPVAIYVMAHKAFDLDPPVGSVLIDPWDSELIIRITRRGLDDSSA